MCLSERSTNFVERAAVKLNRDAEEKQSKPTKVKDVPKVLNRCWDMKRGVYVYLVVMYVVEE